ncbi:DUF4998 domain-containing protein [Membranicola marinus]|uniref:DUF4998 domain-containing protein n=1 Tax=Membranihabitans marinus TaxID=1227546 RepID=A0A953HV24_9BACT|nr:DUF4998 domain-containing protein [Membranihabitans marinus]MBY5958383.1 DUF4998 domain-containing protein [Membranihabitans marinus]
MKNILFILYAYLLLVTGCEDIYEKQAEFEGEVVYPAKYDTIIGHIGFERVEIDLLKAGRIPSSAINLGKATKTKIEYDDEVITLDSLVSYVNITGLDQSKLYRFKISTLDEYGNESVPQEIALIPFTQEGLNNLVVSPPRILASPSAAVVEWPSGISSVLMEYESLKYSYTDKEGVERSGGIDGNPRFFVGNVTPGQPITINMAYRVIPRVNQKEILDTLTITDELVINMPTETTPFTPAEKDILAANGVTTFTAQGVSDVTKLTYPVHARSLQDIFFFPNLKTLDLTGGDLFEIPTLTYDRNGVVDVVGGGDFVEFLRKAGDIPTNNYQSLKDLLEAGILEKVIYRPHSMGLDELLAPYVDDGTVELVDNPAEIYIDNKFHLDGNVQDHNWNMEITYPATDAPQSSMELKNVYKTVPKARSASFVFALPKEYEFNIEEYKYLKASIYAPEKSVFTGEYTPFQKIWPRFMNRMWSFADFSNFGQQYWAIDAFELPDSYLGEWKEVTVDMSNALDKHNRVIVLNIGGEPGISNWDPPKEIEYYWANLRFSKTE